MSETTMPVDCSSMATHEDSIALVSGLGLEEAIERLRIAVRLAEVGHRAVAFYLEEIDRTRQFSLKGFASTVQLARRALGMSRREARDLLEVGRALVELPLIDAAFREKQLTWTKVRNVAKVAVRETDAQWLATALELSCADLQKKVANLDKGDSPRKQAIATSKPRLCISVSVGKDVFDLWRKTRETLSVEADERLTDEAVLKAAFEAILSTRPEGGCDGRVATEESLYRVFVEKCPECRRASVLGESDRIVLEEKEAARIEAKAEVVKTFPAVIEGATNTPTSPALREYIHARDGGRCVWCGGWRGLMAHHIEFRGEGGPTEPRNEILACSACHSLVHDGLLRIEGDAPDDLRFFDREGNRLERETISGPLVTVVSRNPSIGVGLEGGAQAPPPAVITFETLPSEVDAGWLREHLHLLRWNERREALEFEEGVGIEQPMGETLEAKSLAHRPSRLSEFVGQAVTVRSLDVAVRAARKQERPLDHVLLLGPPGVGKTTLALSLATEMGSHAHVSSGPVLNDAATLLGRLAALRDRDVLIIDELHAVPRRVSEVLYEAMEDERLSLTITDGLKTRSLRVTLARFTLVGATTEPHVVAAPLRSRFTIQETLLHYDDESLAVVIERAFEREELAIEREAALTLAKAAHGTPREALSLVRRVRDEVVVHDHAHIDARLAKETLASLEIDERGLGPIHRRILDVLRAHGGPMGLARLAEMIAIPLRALRDEYEPPLLRLGLVIVTPRGRVLA